MISTIESESTSRSSVNDLSSWTSPAGTPATSLTISARPARTSSVVGMDGAPCRCEKCGLQGIRGGVAASWQDDHLSGEDQSGAEPDDQAGLAAVRLAGLEQGLKCQGDRGCRGVALPRDVSRDDDLRGELEGAEHGVGDPHVRLVWREDVEVLGPYAGCVHGLRGGLGHR